MGDAGRAAAAASSADPSGVRVPPFFEFVGVFLIGLLLELVLPTSAPSADVRVAVALAAGAAWLVLDLGAIFLFGAAGTTIWPNWRENPAAHLVTTGPYRVTRNPQYVGLACLYVAVAFALGALWPLTLLPLMLVFLDRVVIPREEGHLEARFGPEYRDFKARVRRWL